MNSTGCDDGPAGIPTDAADSLLIIRTSSTSAPLLSASSRRLAPPIGVKDALSTSVIDDCCTGYVSGADMPELGGGWAEYGAESDDSTCMPPYCSAAISWGERGRDLRLSFCRRFWNHICKGCKQNSSVWFCKYNWVVWNACRA